MTTEEKKRAAEEKTRAAEMSVAQIEVQEGSDGGICIPKKVIDNAIKRGDAMGNGGELDNYMIKMLSKKSEVASVGAKNYKLAMEGWAEVAQSAKNTVVVEMAVRKKGECDRERAKLWTMTKVSAAAAAIAKAFVIAGSERDFEKRVKGVMEAMAEGAFLYGEAADASRQEADLDLAREKSFLAAALAYRQQEAHWRREAEAIKQRCQNRGTVSVPSLPAAEACRRRS